MPQDAKEDQVSSTDPTLDEQQTIEPVGTVESPADAAKSSDATGEEDKSLLDVVRDVVGKSRGTDTQAASPAEGEEDGDQGDKPAKKQDDENYEDVPFHKHPRFQDLLRKSKTFEQDAIRYQNVQGFLDSNGLTAEEASDMLVIGAMAKTNPAEAWKHVKPWVQNLLIASGEVLPEDLQKRVQAGELSAEAALEVSRSTAAVRSMQATQSFQQQQEERRRQQQAGSAITNAASTWEADRRVKDPNFDAKVEPLMKEVAWLQAKEGKPSTPDGVKDQLQRAYRAVNASFAPPAPRPAPRPAVRPVTGGQVAGKAAPTDMSTLDIVRAGRRSA